MRLLLSTEPKPLLRRCHRSFRGIATIDINEVREQLGKSVQLNDDVYTTFLINQEIMARFDSYYKSKRFHSILYVVDRISTEFVVGLKAYYELTGMDLHEIVIMQCHEDHTLDPELVETVNAVI